MTVNEHDVKKSIVFIGRICSGKSSLAKIVSTALGIAKASFGGYLAELAPKFDLDINRENLQNLGQSLIDENPEKFLRDVIAFSGSSDQMIFEGVRHRVIKEKIELSSETSISFYIEVPPEIRLKRCIERDDITISAQEFNQWDSHVVEMEIETLKSECTYILDGTLSLSELSEQVSKNLKNLS